MQLKRGLCQMMYQMSTRKCSGEKRSEPLTAAETGTHSLSVSKCYWITDGTPKFSLWAKKKVRVQCHFGTANIRTLLSFKHPNFC